MDWIRNRSASIALALVIGLGAALRWHQLTARSIWFDEAFTWRMIQYSLGEMLRRIALDNSPPLYFILLKYWSACFGDSLLALRSLSVVLGCVAILAMFLFVSAATTSPLFGGPGRRGGDGRGTEAGLFAAVLMAISAFQIRWAWDARPYALGTALALLSSWALVRALGAERATRRWWCAYAGLTILFAYTHYFALFAIVAQGAVVVYVLVHDTPGPGQNHVRWARVWGSAMALSLLVLCWLPWVPVFLRQMSQVRSDFWIHPIQRWDIAHLLYQMFVEPENASLTETTSLWVLDLCVVGWVVLLWRARWETVLVAASAWTPIGLTVVLDGFGIHLFLLRYLLFAHLFFLAGLAMLVSCRIPFPLERRLVAAVLAAWGLIGWYAFSEKADFAGHPGSQGAAAWIVQQGGSQEPVLASSPFCFLPMLYHLRERGNCFLYQEDATIPHYLGTAVLCADDVMSPQMLRDSAAARVWVVDTTNSEVGVRETPHLRGWTTLKQEVFPDVFRLGDVTARQYVTPVSMPR